MRIRAHRFASRTDPTRLGLHLLIVVNAVLLTVIGALYLFFAERPQGLIVTAVTWGLTVLLLLYLRLTDPRRRDASRW